MTAAVTTSTQPQTNTSDHTMMATLISETLPNNRGEKRANWIDIHNFIFPLKKLPSDAPKELSLTLKVLVREKHKALTELVQRSGLTIGQLAERGGFGEKEKSVKLFFSPTLMTGLFLGFVGGFIAQKFFNTSEPQFYLSSRRVEETTYRITSTGERILVSKRVHTEYN